MAIADGTIQYAHNISGFGDPYPVLIFDTPINGNQGCYYGHNHPEVAEGAHVRQGDVIAHALQVPGGNARNMPGWLEIGWWNGGPPPGSGWTPQGQNMHDTLINAPIWETDMPLTDEDIAKVAAAVRASLDPDIIATDKGLLTDFWNNQFGPKLNQMEADILAIKKKVGA